MDIEALRKLIQEYIDSSDDTFSDTELRNKFQVGSYGMKLVLEDFATYVENVT